MSKDRSPPESSGAKLTVSRFYSRASETGTVLGLRCENDHVTVPPRRTCKICGSTKLIETTLRGVGSLISFTKVYVKSADFPIEAPYNLGLVRLEEGGNLLGIINTDETKTPPTLNSKVRIRFKKIPENSDRPRIFFDIEPETVT
jgi:uncharacterized OB-fold protein